MIAGADFNRFDGRGSGRNNFLDCIRAFAALLVIAVHSHVLNGGGIGVSMFFCLSGYLIASILIEIEPGAANIRNFLFRRFMRIWPMMAAQIVASTVLIAVWTPEIFSDYVNSIPSLLTFVSRADLAYLPCRSVLWTLQAEFWFYLLVAGTVFLFGRGGLFVAAVVGMLVAWIFKFSYIVPAGVPMRGTLIYLDQFMIGVFCVFVVRYCPRPLLIVFYNRLLCLWLPILGILVGATLTFRGYDSGWFYTSSGAAYLTALMIAHQTVNPLKGDYEPLAAIGRSSYSIYLLHPLVIDYFPWPQFPVKLDYVFVYALIFAVSAVTYRWIELPFINWSKRAAPFIRSSSAVADDPSIEVVTARG